MTHPIYISFIADHVKDILESNNANMLAAAFVWTKSNEGSDYWSDVKASKILTDEARKKLQGYLDKRPG